MRFGGSKEFSSAERKVVRFGGETICALKRAFEKNPEVAKGLEEIVGEKNMRMFTDILTNTNEMEIKYDPSDDVKTVYGQIAKRELERIDAEDEDDEDLSCGHTADDHREALEAIVETMKTTIQ